MKFGVSLDIIVIILSIILSLIIFLRDPRNKRNQSFSVLVGAIVIWLVTVLLTDNSATNEDAFFWGRLAIIGPILILPALVNFAISFPFPTKASFKYRLVMLLPFILLLFVGTDLNVTSAKVQDWGTALDVGNLYTIYFFIFIAYLVGSIRLLVNKSKTSELKVKKQVRYVVAGMAITALISTITNLLLIIINVQELSVFGPPSMIILVLFTFYAIVKYQFLDIRILLGRFTYYLLLSLIVLITYRVVLLTNNFIWGDALDVRGMITGAVFAFIFVAFYDKFKTFVQSRISNVLINPGFEPNEVIVNFNKTISTLLDYEEIASLLEQTVAKTIRPSAVSVFVRLEEQDKVILKTESDKASVALNYENIYRLWQSSTYIPIFLDQIELEVPRKFSSAFHELSIVVEEMRQKGIKLILPIGIKENSNGVLVLGSKEGDSSYNSVQIKYLESLCEITALALMRAKLYEEVQEFNETLQQKVKDATLEIQSQNSKLSEALRVERDMLDVLGHELRTPLGTIRNAMGVVDLKYKSKQFTNADLEAFLKVGSENIRREIQLLETILASAKIDNDKLDMNFEKVDSNDVVADSFEAYKYDAEKKGLKLVQTLPNEVIYSYADRLRIQQVMDNLVSNSIKYTEKGQVELKVADEGKYVRFSITDTGEGIPEEDIAKLGTKFFRANMYLKSEGKLGDRRIVRPGGTGIGLYVVYQIVKFMYGEVKVTSKLGEGSTFSFTVLKYTPELENKNSFILAGKDSVRTYNNEDIR